VLDTDTHKRLRNFNKGNGCSAGVKKEGKGSPKNIENSNIILLTVLDTVLAELVCWTLTLTLCWTHSKYILLTIKIHFLFNSIVSNPSIVRCNLDFIKIDASLKSLKSLAFTPCILYSSKKGIILSVISDKFLTEKVTIPDFSTIFKKPQPKICAKLANLLAIQLDLVGL
jgi:hypothetical protein